MGHPKEDHNQQEFKRQIKGEILDLLKKSSKKREEPYKWSTIKYNSITSRTFENIL